MDNNLEHDYIMGYINRILGNDIRIVSFDYHYKICYTDVKTALFIGKKAGDNIVIIKRSIPDKIILDWCIL